MAEAVYGDLDAAAFAAIITHAPLVAIDLIIRNPAGSVLLGFRTNEPARGTWFVPGGRIRKDETLDAAFERISAFETGRVLTRDRAQALEPQEHFYDNNALALTGIGTHYLVLPHEIGVSGDFDAKIDSQHAELRWWPVDELLSAADVHEHVKRYFR